MQETHKFKENLEKLMQQTKTSQSELANKIGVSAPAVNQWLKGASVPKGNNLKVIADIFDVTVDELMYSPVKEDEEVEDKIGEKADIILREIRTLNRLLKEALKNKSYEKRNKNLQ